MEENLGISGNSNRALQAAKGAYVALLDHDDVLTEDALYWVVDALQRERYDVVYSDEDRMAENGSHYLEPRFKPEFDIDLLRAYNYIPICLWHGESLCWRTEAFIVSMMVRRATI